MLFGTICRQWIEDGRGRVLVMAHREELIFQAADKIALITGEQPDIEMGDSRADQCSLHARANVVITSVQTMCRPNRHGRFDPSEFTLLIIDEAHHATAATYQHASLNTSARIRICESWA